MKKPTIRQIQKRIETIVLTERTLAHINGMPFWLPKGTAIQGRRSNFNIAKPARIAG